MDCQFYVTSIMNIKHAYTGFSNQNNVNVQKINLAKEYVGDSTHTCCKNN